MRNHLVSGSLVLCVGALVSGCDPGWSIEGTVSAPDGGRVADAEVFIRCNPGALLGSGAGFDDPLLGPVDVNGRFSAGGIGCGADIGCQLVVTAPGYAAWDAGVSALCAAHESGSWVCDSSKWCSDVAFEAHLVPDSAGSGLVSSP